MDEEKRPVKGGTGDRAGRARAPGDFLGDRLKRLEEKRSRTSGSRTSQDDVRAGAKKAFRDSKTGLGADAGRPGESADRAAPFPEDTDARSGAKRLVGRGIPLSRDNEDFLREQSFGPVCGLYMASPVSWPYLLPLTLGLIPLAQLGLPAGAFGVAVCVCLFCPPVLATAFFHVGLLLLNRPWDLAGSLPMSSSEPSVIAGYIYIGAGWLVLAYIFILGRWLRRGRWRRFEWRSFEAFRRSEDSWSLLGGFLAVIIAAIIVGTFALGGLDRLAEWLQRFYYTSF